MREGASVSIRSGSPTLRRRARGPAVDPRHLDQAPSRVAFRYGSHGKPELTPPIGGALHFNLSHAETRGLCAVTLKHEVGVDIERDPTPAGCG